MAEEKKKVETTQPAANPTSTRALSAQEQAIREGKKVVSGTASDRVVRMFEAMRAYGPPRVALERSVLFTEAFKENENDPLVLRWAKALKRYAEKSTVAIFDDELIVGRPNTWLGRWAIVYAELDGAIMPDGVKQFKKNKGKMGEVVVTPEDEKVILNLVVRIAGYSAYFVDLSPMQQAEIIARTEEKV